MNAYLIILLEGSSVAHLFQEQITHITIKTNNDILTYQSLTDTCARILAICKKLSYLDMNQWIKENCAALSLCDRPPNICFSSHLRTLSINVKIFDDCLCLLDGRLEQLYSFTVNIQFIKRLTTITDSQVCILYLK